MLWALSNGARLLASPKSQAFCPTCGGEVIAKCGEIVSWHWAHKQCDCDPWYEPESDWHINWKQKFPQSWQEVTVGNHRADISTPSGVIELQNSPLSASEIYERENFYGRMIWIVNAQKFKENLHHYVPVTWRTDYIREKKKPEWQLFPPRPPGGLIDLLDEKRAKWENHPLVKKKQNEYQKWVERRCKYSVHFQWNWPRKTWLNATKKVYLDLGGSSLYLISGSYGRKRTYISTRPISKETLLTKLIT